MRALLPARSPEDSAEIVTGRIAAARAHHRTERRLADLENSIRDEDNQTTPQE
ncbi:hypothetical protein [Streptomyces termitum]|uniref:hypothetical protein n=1 Tax=Streptomyces termitum TaxID=67368 RepID=UPI0033BE9C6E